MHWQFVDIATGHSIGSSEHTVLGAFSSRKVSVLLACLALVHTGKLSLHDTYVIDSDLNDGVQAGIMRHLTAGIELSLRDHLAQMMTTSDNICTQIVFRAIEEVTGDPLQWVNDYCAQVGMYDTLHREIFPRSAQLTWSHSIESMTVTSAQDQAVLLEQLARGSQDDDAAAALGLTVELCALAIDLMGTIYTPMLGVAVERGRFAEKNGRGIRGLSQVGLFLDDAGQPVASVAVFAESIPVELRNGVPGRVRATELFAAFGQAIESWYLGSPHGQARQSTAVRLDADLADVLYAMDGDQTDQVNTVFDFAGVGKLIFACTLAGMEACDPELFDRTLVITEQHRTQADTGTLRHLTGSVRLTVDDAIRLMIGSGDAAAALALLEYFETRGVDIVEHGRRYVAALDNTTITGVEQRSSGEGFTGTTTAADLLKVLRHVIDDNGRVKHWMASVFEPAGLANALPGYGPHTVKHWTVSGWTRLAARAPERGWTSVLILESSEGPVGLVAHAPAGTGNVVTKLGGLGLAAYTGSRF